MLEDHDDLLDPRTKELKQQRRRDNASGPRLDDLSPDEMAARGRELMHKAIDKSLENNLRRIDQLINNLHLLKEKLIQGADLVKIEIGGHYDFAGEAVSAAEEIAGRFLDVQENGHAAREASAVATAPGRRAAADGAQLSTDDTGAGAGAVPSLAGAV